MAFNWNCPYCDRPQTAIDANTHETSNRIHVGEAAEGKLAIDSISIACVNPDCRRTTVRVFIAPAIFDGLGKYKGINFDGEMRFNQRLLPQGSGKPQPECIPQAIRDDYQEACLICDLSPKASATLTRRCLQGMIRDFCGISKSRLIDEINALRKAVEDGSADRAIAPETVEAIDQVRGVGNIGAHMEKDIDQIVPVDPGEAQTLIELIEMLFEEWYVAREKRRGKLASIATMAASKRAIQQNGGVAQPLLAAPESG